MRGSRRSSWSSVMRSSSSPVMTSPPRSSPACFAMAAAVLRWSPVIMTVRTDADAQVRMASFAAGRGGSSMPNKPRKTSPSCACESDSQGFSAHPRTRSASVDNASACAVLCRRSSDVSGTSPAFVRIRLHLFSSTSHAPLTQASAPPFPRTSTAMHLVSLSNGSSAMRVYSDSVLGEIPPFAAAARSAASVGSPTAFHWCSPTGVSWALLQSTAQRKSSRIPGVRRTETGLPCSKILPSATS